MYVFDITGRRMGEDDQMCLPMPDRGRVRCDGMFSVVRLDSRVFDATLRLKTCLLLEIDTVDVGWRWVIEGKSRKMKISRARGGGSGCASWGLVLV